MVGSAALAFFAGVIVVKRLSARAKTLSPPTPVRGVIGHCINEKTLEDQVRVHLAECLDPPVDQAFAELCCQTITLATFGSFSIPTLRTVAIDKELGDRPKGASQPQSF